jgi:hypothetical protein
VLKITKVSTDRVALDSPLKLMALQMFLQLRENDISCILSAYYEMLKTVVLRRISWIEGE